MTLNEVESGEPNYDDVCDLKDGFEAWRRTYEYRGIKYDVALLYSGGKWFVLEYPQETKHIANTIRSADSEGVEFLYHETSSYNKEAFYNMVNMAKQEIDWFLDDCVDEIKLKIGDLENRCLSVQDAVKAIKAEKQDTSHDQIHDIMLEELLIRLKAMNWDALDEQTLFAIWRIIVKGGKW